jgi:hypothetical protein
MGAEITINPADRLAAAATQMIDWLEIAAADGWDAYRPLWMRLLASVGGSAHLLWDGIWPCLLIGHGEVANLAAQREASDLLYEHLRSHGFRAHLMRSLIGDTEGTREGADARAIIGAVADVVLDFLRTDGRILINPEGVLMEGVGIPRDYGLDETRDLEIERATRAYCTAACCPRAIPLIKRWAQVVGGKTENGWIELAVRHVDWWSLHGRMHAALNTEQTYDRDVWTPAWDAAGGGEVHPTKIEPTIEDEMERLQNARCDLEDFLFEIPSPDSAAFAVKVAIARRDGRDLNGFDDLLVREAGRFAQRAEGRS